MITDRAMMLYAAREPALREPYLSFVDTCLDQVAALITDALAHAGLELTVPIEDAVPLLAATHNHLQTMGLFDQRRADPACSGPCWAPSPARLRTADASPERRHSLAPLVSSHADPGRRR